MVEAKRKAKWPSRRQATRCKQGPNWPPQEVPHECNLSVLTDTGTCKPEGVLTALKRANPGRLEEGMSHNEGELANLKDATPEDLQEKMWHIEGVSWEGFEEPQRPHANTAAQRPRASSPTNKEAHCKHKNQISMAGIEYTDGHASLHPRSIALGHFWSGYTHSF